MKPRFDSLVGQTLAGRYKIERIIGRGGMGAVFEARQLDGGRKVAIKVMPDDDEIAVKRFKREAQTLTRMRHPNVVRIYDFGQVDGLIYLVMEHLRGRPLSSALRKHGHFPPQVAIDVAIQVASALSEAHRCEIVHRDIKPGNIFLIEKNGRLRARVLDFGIAKSLADIGQTQLTNDGSLVGTPLYMAPEQIRTHEVGPRTDIYSLAVVTYEMLTGQPPFFSKNMAEVLVKHLQDKPPPLSKFLDTVELSHIPPGLDDTLARALAKRAENRPASIDDFLQELELHRSKMPALPRSWSPSLEEASDIDEFTAASHSQSRRATSHSGAFDEPRPSTQSVERSRPGLADEDDSRNTKIVGAVLLLGAIIGLGFLSFYASKRNESARNAAARVCAVEGLMECTQAADGTSAIEICRNGTFQEYRRCELSAPCETDSRSARCGSTGIKAALPGAPCESQGARVCDLDARSVVECKFGTWDVVRRCAPGSCEEVGDEYRCENNTFSEGDECDFAEGEFVCSSDGASVLACKDEKVFIQHSCGEGKKCVQFVEAGQPVITCQVDPDYEAPETDAGAGESSRRR